MAYQRQRNVEDGKTLVKEGGTNVTKGPLIHGEDKDGKARVLKISDDGSIDTNISQYPTTPDVGTENKVRFFSGYLGSSGLGQYSDPLINMDVDGSISPKTFFVGADPNYDIHITRIKILIIDNKEISNKRFGSMSKLSIGWDLEIFESGVSTKIISNAKTNGSIITQSDFTDVFGEHAFELEKWDHNNDAFIVTMDLKRWIPSGFRIGRGTTDELRSVVNDNLTPLSKFYIKLFGFKNYPIV